VHEQRSDPARRRRDQDGVADGDLASRAMISRAAFYRNYRDKYDLVEQIFDADALAPSVISAMFVQSIVWWLEHDRPCPPDELAEQSSRLIRAVIEAAGDTPQDPAV